MVARLPQGITNLTGAPFDASSIGGIVDASLQNAALQTAKGVDLTLGYRIDLNGGDHIGLTGSGSYLESERQLTSAKPVAQLAGTIFDPPTWRGRLGATYEAADLILGTYVNYIGSNRDNRIQPAPRIQAFTSVDVIAKLSAGSRSGLLRGVDLSVAAINLLNEKPGRIRNSNPVDPPYDSTNYPATGRVVSLTLTKAW